MSRARTPLGSAAPTALTHAAHRVLQTPRAFRNWPAVLADMARERLGRGPDELTFVTRAGLRISCPNRRGARVPIYEIFAENTYRLAEFLGPLADQPLQALDIGAHVGTFACQLALVAPEARVDAYEPSAITAAYLRRNIRQNALADRIRPIRSAVAARTGVAAFADNGAASGMNGLLVPEPGSVATAATTEVPTVAFDEAVAALPSAPQLVKIDCEGGEYDLVLGSSAHAWHGVQRVVLEYHPDPRHSWADLQQRFGALGLRRVHHEPISAEQGTAWLARG